MATYSYKVYKKQVSYDGGSTWYDVDPLETIKMVTGWNVECSGLTYAGRITESRADCDENASLYEWFIAEKKDKIERSDVVKTWGGAGTAGAGGGVGHHTYGGEIYAIQGCDEVFPKTLHIMPNCTEIGDRAFAVDQKVPQSSVMEREVKDLYYINFEGTSTLRKIGEKAFYNTDLARKIELPDSLEEIGSDAFGDTSYLTHVNIGSGITTIHSGAFYMSSYSYLSTPKVISINKTTPPTLSGDSGLMFNNTIVVPTSSVGAYKSSWFNNDSMYSNIVTSSAKTSHSYEYGGTFSASGYADNLTAVTTSNVTRDTNTHWVKFGDSVVEIGDSLFGTIGGSDYKNLNYVLFGDNLKKIGTHAFNSVPLTELEFPNSLEEICDDAFNKANISNSYGGLTKLKFGNGLKKIGNRAFWMNYIQRLELPNSLEEIGDYAFNGCNCQEIVWPTNLKKIGTEAFGGTFMKNTFATGCTYFDIVLPEGVEEVGSNVFGGGVNDFSNTRINSITFPTTLTKIGNLSQYVSDNQEPTKLVFLSATPPQVLATSGSPVQIFVPCESVNLYRQTSPFNLFPTNIHPIDGSCSESQKRWVRFGYKDIDGQLYTNEIQQITYDSGATWENTGQERQSSTSVGSSSYESVSGVVRTNTSSGTTNTIPSLGVSVKTFTEIYLDVNFTHGDWQGGVDGYLIGDGSGISITPIVRRSYQWGYYYNLSDRSLTASNKDYPGVTKFGNYNIYYTYNSSTPSTYWTGTTAVSTFESTDNMGLFNGNVAGCVKSLQIYEGGTLVRDFEPRYLSSLHTATLYDKVSNTYCEVNGSLDYPLYW